MKNNDVIRHLLEAERHERSLAIKAKTEAERAEHMNKAEAAKSCRYRLQNRGYQRSAVGYIRATEDAREDQRRRIKAMLKRSGV